MLELLPAILAVLGAVLAMGAVALAGVGLYSGQLERFFREVQDESAGGVRSAGLIFVRRLGLINRQILWPRYEASLRKKLIKAGEPKGYRPEDILAMQELGFLVGLLFGLVLLALLRWTLLGAILPAGVGLFYPLLWVSDQVKKRQLQIARALPYDLDLLTLSVEAGLDFTAALAKVVEKGKAGPLREELQLVLKQLKMGKTREEALKSMIARVDLPSLTNFVNALIQADKMGTSLGKVLRIQSTQMRLERTQRAEKLANEAPVKMLFPLVFCIFPTVFLILFGPIAFAWWGGQRLP